MATLQEFQDATLLISIYEEGSNHETTEQSAFVPVSRIVHMMQGEMDAYKASFTPDNILLDQIVTAGDANFGDVAEKFAAEAGLEDSGVGEESKETKDLKKEFGRLAASWMRDCIPCGKRMENFALGWPSLPLEVLQAILGDLLSRLQFLQEILGLLGDTSVFDDMCQLAQFLSYQCVPDLAALLGALAFSMSKWNSEGIKNMNLLPNYWIAQLFYLPFLMAVMGIISRFSNEIKGIVKCIADSLVKQINNLDVKPGVNRIGKVIFDERKRFGDTSKRKDPFKNPQENKARTVVKDGQKGIGDSLNYLTESLNLFRKMLEKEITKLKESLQSVFGMGGQANVSMVDYVKTKMVLARMIGAVRWMIELAATDYAKQWDVNVEAGGTRGLRVTCGEPSAAYDGLLNEMKNFFEDVSNGNVERDNDGNIVWSSIPDTEALKEAAREFKDEFTGIPGILGDEGAEMAGYALKNEDDRKSIGDKMAEMASTEVVVSCKGLAEMLSKNDSATLQQWITDLG